MKAVTIDKYRPVFFGWPEEEEEGPFLSVGEAFGGKAWTDGNIMMAGDPPHQPTPPRKPSFAPVEKRCFMENLSPITPLGVVHDGGYDILVFDDDSLIQAKYYLLVVEAWPDAVFFGAGVESQLCARVHGKPVAALMPMRYKGREDFRNAVLQSANAVPAQPTNQSPEERQQQNEKI